MPEAPSRLTCRIRSSESLLAAKPQVIYGESLESKTVKPYFKRSETAQEYLFPVNSIIGDHHEVHTHASQFLDCGTYSPGLTVPYEGIKNPSL